MQHETRVVTDLSEKVTVDLDNCAREPIHIPGMIQPHGLLLVLDQAGLVIKQASNNALELLGIPATELAGAPLETLLGFDQSAHLRIVLRGDDLIRANPLKLTLPDQPGAKTFDILIHTVGQELIFEAEPTQESAVGDFKTFYQDIRDATARLQKTDTEETLCQVVAEKVREITGFDRAMVYRFDARWNGDVIAESRRDGLASSYLGLHFPASDIPAQARRLYTISRIRCIPDVKYTPVSLVAAAGASVQTGSTDKPDRPLDMSCCVLRSVSPIHLEYLQNMGVAATLTISLLRNGQLWGLIACHHYQPKLVNPERRLICSLIGQIIDSHLKTLGEGGELAYRMQTSALQGRFLDLLTRVSSLNGLAEDPASVLNFVDAQGAAIVHGTHCTLIGQTPEEAEIPGLIDLIKRSLKQGGDSQVIQDQSGPNQGVWVTDSLAESYPVAEKFKDVASGMLGAEISAQRGEYLLWFQPEQIRMVHWGGNPDKPVLVENGTARLHPRKSFELWKQAITLHSKGFKPGEVAAVTELKEVISRVMASEEERAGRLRQREQSLRTLRDQANAASGAKSEFLANMSHEIRTPLTAILGYAQLLNELGVNALASLEQTDAIRAINENSRHLLNIVNDILDISKIEAGKMTIELHPCNLRELTTEVDSLMRQRAQSKQLGFAIEFEGVVPERIQTDVTRFKQILLNLIGNAIKFTEKGSVRVTFRFHGARPDGSPDVSEPLLEVEVADSGIGIHAQLQSNLFEPFMQADSSMSRRFGGTGLD
jgi:chemotaxis family two-component system sensor kinase Cph1